MMFPVNPGRFLDEIHMHKRLHSSLGHLTPAEFKSEWRSEQMQTPDVHQESLRMSSVSGGALN
jgi:hypothetical protein